MSMVEDTGESVNDDAEMTDVTNEVAEPVYPGVVTVAEFKGDVAAALDDVNKSVADDVTESVAGSVDESVKDDVSVETVNVNEREVEVSEVDRLAAEEEDGPTVDEEATAELVGLDCEEVAVVEPLLEFKISPSIDVLSPTGQTFWAASAGPYVMGLHPGRPVRLP